MPSKKKKFIDKKNSVTFTIVHRSQKDPKTVDEEAPQRVLLSSKLEEQKKYGIEFEDEYDYLQHLKDLDELNNCEVETFRISKSSDLSYQQNENKPRLILPSVVFASDVETTVGMLNKNIPLYGPQPDLDPDILAALDGEVQSDEELDDNFVNFANALNDELSDDEKSSNDTMSRSDDDDDDLDKGSQFTGYSMTSSVIRRNENLQLIDAKFEKFYEKFKNDEDDTDIENVDDDLNDYDDSKKDDILQQLIDQYQQKLNSKSLEMDEFVNKSYSHDVKANDKVFNSESEDEEMEKIEIEVPNHNWDCESIISTYSTTKNRPHTVYLPSKKSKKLLSENQISDDVLEDLQMEQIAENQPKLIPQIIRNKNETKEEKMARKRLVKDFRKERRQQKTQTKEIFKDEQLRIKKQLIINKENCIGAVHLK